MPLPVSEVERELVHTRRVRFEGYQRADGLWDIDAFLSDVKSHDFHLASGVRRAGQAVHDMCLRITIDRKLNIVDVKAVSDEVPYPGGCESIAPAYRRLIGLNLLHGFRRQAKEMLGGTQGCTHINELLGLLPTAAIQTFAGQMPEQTAEGRKPFQLDQCHALESSTETVRKYYPTWHRDTRKTG
ncbi:MAG: DUF2889 domain-containing protein [Betaproteobacteria bacterium]|nr:DUF2889 domain-containing protein [Betaproteobacteria bacterium]